MINQKTNPNESGFEEQQTKGDNIIERQII
jgi:hypothetical protein